MSSFSADELREAILSENIAAIKGVKGIGLKTAQRMILELKDKISKGEGSSKIDVGVVKNDAVADEAMAALQMLGFSKPNITKVIQKIISSNPNIKVEELIKKALQML